MITKDQLVASMRHETNVIRHLGAKVTPEMLDYRPTAGQRSMLELMQYMTAMSSAPALYTVTGSWEGGEALDEEAGRVTLETFDAAMAKQMEIIEEALADLDEAEATSKPSAMPWGTPTTVSAGLMDMPLKVFVAYRMQLFLYLKSCGVTDIGPANCWAGVDLPPPAEE